MESDEVGIVVAKQESRNMNIEKKRAREKTIVSHMISIYCRGQHKTKESLCPECAALNDYAIQRTDKCPFMETKTFCSKCKVHCYKPEMREKIRTVMRYAGPRMLIYYPIETIHHGFLSIINRG